jgi:hypothetical protein
MASNRPGRLRIGIEVLLFLVSAALFIATLVEPEWIEMLTGLEPDEGSGSLELAIAAATGLAAVGFAALSGYDLRRRAAARA